MAKRTPPKPKAAAVALPAKPIATIGVDQARAIIESRNEVAAAKLTTPFAAPIAKAPAAPATPAPSDVARVRLLSAENQRLASAAEAAAADLKLALAATLKSSSELGALRMQAAELSVNLGKTQEALAKAQAEIRQLRSSAAPKGDGPLVLTADSVSSLISDFIKSFDGAFGTLKIGSSAVTLKTGFAHVDGNAAFVIPSATAPLEPNQPLHEIHLQLDPRISG